MMIMGPVMSSEQKQLDQQPDLSIQTMVNGHVKRVPGRDPMFGWKPGDPSVILLVDDDPRVRASLPRVLRLWGWDCITANDGLDALERILHTPEIALVISDVDMPRLSGPGLVEWLVHRKPEIPAILITGCHLDESQRAKIPMDVPVLQKPVYPEVLQDCLQNMLMLRPEASVSP